MRNKTNFQKELLQTVAWQIIPSYAHQAKNMILSNKQGGVSFDDVTESLSPERTQFFIARKQNSNAMFEELIVTEDAGNKNRRGCIDSADEVINVIVVDGAITRNGGACSIGSKQHCEMLIEASKMPNCIGHIFLLNSPGGSASSAYDYERGINAAHDAGQPCIGLIDGICASLCTRLSAKLDEVYYIHPNMEVGCIGTMAMFATNKDGDENEVTHTIYHEIYADASSQKNGEFRKCANGDDSGIKEILNKENDIFLEEMRTFRPSVTEEILSGPMYPCKEMEGILVHGQKDFDGCVDRILEMKCKPRCNQNPPQTNVPDAPSAIEESHNTNTLTTMKLKYQTIQSIIGEQENVTEEGFFLNDVNAQAIEERLVENANVLAENEQKITDLTSQLEAANAKIAELTTSVEEKTNALTEAEGKVTELTAQAEQTAQTHEAALAAQKESYDKTVEELNATIESKDNEIEELSHAVPQQNAPEPATAGEGEGDEEKTEQKVANISDMNMSREEMIKAFNERSKLLGAY